MPKRCILIGSSPGTDIKAISRLMHRDDYIICADGGYVFAERLGIIPDLIVGDFDSSERPENSVIEIIALPVRKDDTDMLYAVKEGIKRGCDEFILCGATGGRLDHTYANFCTLKYLADRKIPACIADGKNEIRIINASVYNTGQKTVMQNFEIMNKAGCGFGIFPFGCDSCEISLKGFEYGADNIRLTSDFPIGVSNKIVNNKAEVCVYDGCAIIILESM